jgi:phosphoribosyl 1,2-cyclic phosphodiesterase
MVLLIEIPIKFLGEGNTTVHLIDCGKTFRESVIRFFRKVFSRSPQRSKQQMGVQFLDSVWLTHEHADAILGIDDLRDLQPLHTDKTLPIFCTAVVRRTLLSMFPYLFRQPPPNAPFRYVAKLETKVGPVPPPSRSTTSPSVSPFMWHS